MKQATCANAYIDFDTMPTFMLYTAIHLTALLLASNLTPTLAQSPSSFPPPTASPAWPHPPLSTPHPAPPHSTNSSPPTHPPPTSSPAPRPPLPPPSPYPTTAPTWAAGSASSSSTLGKSPKACKMYGRRAWRWIRNVWLMGDLWGVGYL